MPSPAPKPPAGPNWIHEIKLDGYRLLARRTP
jgi:bifunctional non-homologous end joining protein LigD